MAPTLYQSQRPRQISRKLISCVFSLKPAQTLTAPTDFNLFSKTIHNSKSSQMPQPGRPCRIRSSQSPFQPHHLPRTPSLPQLPRTPSIPQLRRTPSIPQLPRTPSLPHLPTPLHTRSKFRLHSTTNEEAISEFHQVNFIPNSRLFFIVHYQL